MVKEPRWKAIRGFPLYEISEEGQVRFKDGVANYGGKIKVRYWQHHSTHDATTKLTKERTAPWGNNGKGTLTVRLCKGHSMSKAGNMDAPRTPNGRTARVNVAVPKLMDSHWPDVEYPDEWKNVYGKKRGERKGYVSKLTDRQMLEIMDSDLPTSELATMYDISVSYCRGLRAFKYAIGRGLLREGRGYLDESEAAYWLDSLGRGERLKRKMAELGAPVD